MSTSELEQQLAAAPDAEKIADVLWSWHEQGRLNRQDVSLALAQVCAPLVKALEDISALQASGLSCSLLLTEVRKMARAALTGTGEKR